MEIVRSDAGSRQHRGTQIFELFSQLNHGLQRAFLAAAQNIGRAVGNGRDIQKDDLRMLLIPLGIRHANHELQIIGRGHRAQTADDT